MIVCKLRIVILFQIRLINQVAHEIWECRDGGIHIWKGDILSYKEDLIAHMDDVNVNDAMGQSADNKKTTVKAPSVVRNPNRIEPVSRENFENIDWITNVNPMVARV